jgi:hypothetical protein
MTRIKGPHGDETESWANQRRDEPMPASHDDDPDQAAVARNEEHAAAHSADQPGQSGQAGHAEKARSAKADDPANPERRQGLAPGEGEGPGKAIRDMMSAGPGPQGDVPDAPAVQVATTQDAGDSGDRPGPPDLMSNAVPGKPDGEVDTRP